MYTLLILREEVICLVILIFLLLTSRMYHLGKEGKAFLRLMIFAITHVFFDMVTVWTVNHIKTVPGFLNYICHIMFYLSAMLFSHEIFHYVQILCYPLSAAKKTYLLGLLPMAVYLLCLPFLPMHYEEVLKPGTEIFAGTYSSEGLAADAGYIVAFIYFFATFLLLFFNRKKIPKNVLYALFPMMVFLMVVEILQLVYPELLFTGGAITIVSVGFFFSLENPIHVFERKAMTDALTGVGSRHSYETDIAAIEKNFHADARDKYIFAFCDINNLRSVNGLYGHQEGDHCITLVATALSKQLEKAERVYRMGGDEFLVMYKNVEESEVIAELQSISGFLDTAGEKLEYQPSVAIGYAVSGRSEGTIRDTLRTADYMMYRNKTEMKRQRNFSMKNVKTDQTAMGTRLNLMGLTNRLFDAMSAFSDRNYPFIMNMDTGVTRISKAWKEYFGLPSEFVSNFVDLWVSYIHPEDRQNFTDDFQETLAGNRAYHDCRYRVLTPNGNYVLCTCHGGIFHGHDGEPDIFAGYLTNFGMKDSIDPVTGLHQLDVAEKVVADIQSQGESAAIVNIEIDSLRWVNLLYGYGCGDEILRLLAEKIRQEIGDRGEVFRQGSATFTMVLKNINRSHARGIYSNIKNYCLQGTVIDGNPVKINVSSGGYMLTSGNREGAKVIRAALNSAAESSRNEQQGNLVFYN